MLHMDYCLQGNALGRVSEDRMLYPGCFASVCIEAIDRSGSRKAKADCSYLGIWRCEDKSGKRKARTLHGKSAKLGK
jgi:hypothetical protein